MMRRILLVVAFCVMGVALAATPSEITVDLTLDAFDFVSGERVRGVIDVANSSPETIGVGGRFNVWDGEGPNRVLKAQYDVNDRLFVEVYRVSNMAQLSKVSKGAFVANFALESGEGQRLEVFLGDHYGLHEPSRYLAKPVFVHNGIRYEGQSRVFDIVEGVRVGSAMQMFADEKNVQRNFELVYWSKNHGEHLYLKTHDSGSQERFWRTRDLGPLLRLDLPILSILPSGEVVVLHRYNQDQYMRTEFWSLSDEFIFRSQMLVNDPETAGTKRVRELYKDKGVAPKANPWWKFW